MLTKTEIQFIRSLADKKARDEHRMFVVEGVKMVRELLRSGFDTRRLLASRDFSDIEGCETITEKELSRISSLKTPQGILALVRIPDFNTAVLPGGELSLALDGIQDPGNLGTIIRTADWFGIGSIFCSPDTADCYGPKAVQASMGSVFRVRVQYTDLHSMLAGCVSRGIPVYAAAMDGEDIYRTEIADTRKGIILMGREGSGIREGVVPAGVRSISIPSFGKGPQRAESLNVSIAAALICGEFRRRAQDL